MRENTVILYGQVYDKPIIAGKNGQISRVSFPLLIIRRNMSKDHIVEGRVRFDVPLILGRSPEMIQVMKELRKGDMIYLKGNYCTRNTKKKTVCTECGHENILSGVSSYINPIYIDVREQKLTEAQGIQLLKQRAEISNLYFAFGNLCNDPSYYEEDGKKRTAQFQIATGRKYHIKEDPPDKKSDFPWVKVYGPIAEDVRDYLHTSSVIFINGSIQTREIERTIECEECKKPYIAAERITEIVPYSIEMVANCDLPIKDAVGEVLDGEEEK